MHNCRVCKEDKDSSLFVKNQNLRLGHENICKACKVIQTTKDRKRDPYKHKAWKFKTTPEHIKELLDTNKECQICGDTTRRLVIDHDHGTNRIRGILCHTCNTAIGMFREDDMLLRRAIAYLEDAYRGIDG